MQSLLLRLLFVMTINKNLNKTCQLQLKKIINSINYGIGLHRFHLKLYTIENNWNSNKSGDTNKCYIDTYVDTQPQCDQFSFIFIYKCRVYIFTMTYARTAHQKQKRYKIQVHFISYNYYCKWVHITIKNIQ